MYRTSNATGHSGQLLLVTYVPLVHVQRLVHKQMDFAPPGRVTVVPIVSDWGILL